MEHLFISSPEEYVRDINPMSSYVQLSSFYVAKMTGDSYDDVRSWLSTQIANRNPQILAGVPQIKYLSKETGNGKDRHITYEPLDKYIGTVAQSNRLIAPSGTVYKHPDMERSLFTLYVDEGRVQRNYFKGLMHEAKVSGDYDTAEYNNKLQNGCKIDNNTLSGAQMSPATILHTQSAHPSLTSTGRVSTTIANLINERMLVGNMHYMNSDIVMEHLNVLAYTADKSLIRQCVDLYGLKVPTTDDILTMVKKSIGYYFISAGIEPTIRAFLDVCDDEEKCNIMYNGSIWNLITINPELMRTLLDDLSEPADDPYDFDTTDKIISQTYGDLKILAVSLCYELMRGKSLKGAKETDKHAYGLVAATIDKINERLMRYEPLLKAFFKLEVLPNNVYDVETLHRLCVVTSDTDSTNFSCQEICKFMTGQYDVGDKSTKITFLLTYFSSMIVCQALGMMSKNLGVEMPRIRELSMKNEFFIPIHCLTTSAKNYIMVQGAQEGNILPELDLVTKGVELRNSRIPKAILEQFDVYKKSIFLRTVEGEKLFMMDFVKPIVTLEREVLDLFTQGRTKYMSTINVKTPDSYSDEEEASQWKYHLFYDNVFGPKYGKVMDVPYMGYLATVNLGNKTKLNKWVASIKDPLVRSNAERFITENKIDKINKMIFPDIYFSDNPLPEEVRPVLIAKNMTIQILSPWYLLFESFGIFLRNQYDSKLISEVFGDFVDHPDSVNPAFLEADLDDIANVA